MEIPTERFDLIIIGSGPAGYLPAILAARKGVSAAVIEKAELGGTCLNRGCIPSKTLLHEALHLNHLVDSGLVKNRDELSSFFRHALEKKKDAVNQVVSGLRKMLNRDPITVISGEASFINPRTLSVKRDGKIIRKLESDRILIGSGAVPAEAPPLKKDGEWIIGSDEALQMAALPASMAIVGAGRRGVEFSVFFNTFGVSVSLIEKESRILPKMDREISTRYRGLLTKRGIKLFTDTRIVAVDVDGEKKRVILDLAHKDRKDRVEVQKVLIVGDRRANTDGLDIERASLNTEGGFIPVDSRMKTRSPGIYAAGDMVGKPFLAHKAFLEGKIALENLLGKENHVDYRFVPVCVYAYPEAASIGLTEEEAKEKWGDVKIGKFPFVGCGRAVAASEQEGMVKIITEGRYGEILGVHILGPGATEMIHLGAMAMKHEIGAGEIKEMIFAHPTLSEAFFEAALDISDEAIHIMKG